MKKTPACQGSVPATKPVTVVASPGVTAPEHFASERRLAQAQSAFLELLARALAVQMAPPGNTVPRAPGGEKGILR